MEKNCESCGMPMIKPVDFGGSLAENIYCSFCCDNSGKLKPFETRKAEMADFISNRKGISKEEAINEATEAMKKMKAWQSYF